eukprot:CAMPEP_0176450436 /NCGR_PEP_ID=MMETSP0127-20121128/27148_1 /TAXON_ID=938130 /ORGANISM="Platyophrya macrostoma, Strain WH" /LENGTH=415 /DNA_ID=CAMNT_0017838117 /DNA_START=36 /DNA_END=1283 /DNA_ORIENTATION=+
MERLSQISSHLSANPTADSGDVFGHLKLAPPDPILGTALAYKADKSDLKMNLGVGAYRDDNEKPYVFEVVRKVERELVAANLNKEYLPIEGDAEFNKLAQKLVFGKNCPKIITSQALSGTGALRVGFEFLGTHRPGLVYISNPSWANHFPIVERSGLKHTTYPYFDPKTNGLNFKGMIDCLSQAPEGSIVLLHACAHNPSGVDPTEQQWREIADVVQKKKLFTFFDSAYQGFASGDLQKDAFPIRLFYDLGLQMIVTQSFAKNFGLYGERIGAIHFVCKDTDVAARLESQLKVTIRPMYSNPPIHGALIVKKVLGNPEYFKEWERELKMVSQRIQDMRRLLHEELLRLKVKGNWDHIINQIGMFSFTGLTPKQCDVLTEKYHVYLVRNGRISMCGITTKNVGHLAKAMKDAVENY